MFSLIGWLIYGVIVGLLSRWIHPGEEKPGLLWTLIIGVVGSYVGGFINWVIGNGVSPLQSSGILMGVLGGVIFLWAWRWWNLRQQGKSFMGKSLK